MSSYVTPTATDGTSGVVYGNASANFVNAYHGFTLINTSQLQAETLIIREKTDSGLILDIVELSPRESRSDWYGPQGIAFHGAIYLDYTIGSIVTGSLRIGTH